MTIAATATPHGAAPSLPPYKRPLDLAGALLLLALLAPLILVCAVLVRLTSAGPAFYLQTRVGLHGRPFRMIKLRTMYPDAEARRAALARAGDRPGDSGGTCFKMRRDPRVTPVGRVLRRLSIDELPQLVNVIRGEMSLVGPRPALPEEVAAFPGHALGRHETLPGMTGPWQVAGRADLAFERMIELDLAYVRALALGTDLRILAATFRAVVGGRGAY